MDITEIETILSNHKPQRKASTTHSYGLLLHRISKTLNLTTYEDFLDCTKIVEHLKEKKATCCHCANVCVAIQEYLKALPMSEFTDEIQMWKKHKDNYYEIYYNNQRKGVVVGRQAPNMISYKELLGYYNTICKHVKDNEYEEKSCVEYTNGISNQGIDYLNVRLLLRLLLLHPTRNDYGSLEMISGKEFSKIETPMKNYLVYQPTKGSFLSINVYKTVDRYGQKTIPIKDNQLKKLLVFHKKKFGMGAMFRQQNMVQHNSISMAGLMTKYSKKHIDKSVGSTIIYKVIIQELSGKYKEALQNEDTEDMSKYREDLEKFANCRGHSFGIQQQIYAKE